MEANPNNSSFQPSDNATAINILTKEYDTIMAELHYIHDKKITFAKLYGTLVILLLGYALTGIVTYLQLQKDVPTCIPATLVYAYSFLGGFFALLIYIISYYMYCHLISHKKHIVRYWKAIHVIRQGFANLCPSVDRYLLLPKYEEHKDRPHMSNRWEVGIFIYPAYNCMFFVILSILISPVFVTNSKTGLHYPAGETIAFYKAQVVLLPFLLLALALGSNIMKGHWKNIEAARKITLENIFPEVLRLGSNGLNLSKNFYEDSKYSAKRKIITFIHVLLIILTALPLISMFACPHDIINEGSFKRAWYLEIWLIIFFSIFLEFVFVLTYIMDSKSPKNQPVANKKT